MSRTVPLGELYGASLSLPDGAAVLRDALLSRDDRRTQDLIQLLPPMRRIPPGSYVQGSPPEEEGRWEDEGPQRQVTLSRGFWLGAVPVTQALYQAVTGHNPSDSQGPERPVECVSWLDCQAFLAALNERLPGFGFRLSTEAEWEYACRAGTAGPWYSDLDRVAWWSGNSGGQTHPVGRKAPNAWGLYDMLGNVDEWCLDGLDRLERYPPGPVTDPVGGVGPLGCSVVARGSTTPGTCGRRTAAPSRPSTTSPTSASGWLEVEGPFECSVVARGTTTPGTCGRRTATPTRPASAAPSSASGWLEVEGSGRVLRGGSWNDCAKLVRAAARYAGRPGDRYAIVGFRLAGGVP